MASGLNSATFPRALRIVRRAFTLRRFFNLARCEFDRFISDFSGKIRCHAYPPALMTEPAGICNLKCPLCSRGSGGAARGNPFLDVNLYRSIIDELAPSLWVILFWNQGEPFLHPDFLSMVRYAADRKIYTLASTNGHFLTNPDKIIDSGLDEMIVSLDGATEETYLKYRIGGNFDKVVSGIRAFAKRKAERCSVTPRLTIQFVITRQNEHEVKAVELLAKKSGADELIYKTVEIPPGNPTADYIPENPLYRRYSEDPSVWIHKPDGKNCRELWRQPVLNSDGKLSACCFDKEAELSPGCAVTGRFYSIWTGEIWNGIRKKVRDRDAGMMPCRFCTGDLNLNFRSIKFR